MNRGATHSCPARPATPVLRYRPAQDLHGPRLHAPRRRRHGGQRPRLSTATSPTTVLRMVVQQPLVLTETGERFDIFVTVEGGGNAGQAGAIRHGISRALLVFDAALRERLKGAGLLTRDPRKKERKKYGQKGARARFQFSKR